MPQDNTNGLKMGGLIKRFGKPGNCKNFSEKTAKTTTSARPMLLETSKTIHREKGKVRRAAVEEKPRRVPGPRLGKRSGSTRLFRSPEKKKRETLSMHGKCQTWTPHFQRPLVRLQKPSPPPEKKGRGDKRTFGIADRYVEKSEKKALWKNPRRIEREIHRGASEHGPTSTTGRHRLCGGKKQV